MQREQILAKFHEGRCYGSRCWISIANRCAAESIIKIRSRICLWQTQKEIQCAQ